MEISGRISSLFNFCSLLTFQVQLLVLLVDAMNEVKGSKTVLTSTAGVPMTFHMEVTYACDSTATLAWTTHNGIDDLVSMKCELTYRRDDMSAEILDIILDSHSRLIKLFNLSHGDSYTVFVVCGGLFKTNEVSFISDSHCEDKYAVSNHTLASSDTDKNMVPSYFHASSFDMVEWPIAVTFAIVGVVIGAVVAFYMWKKYQRRQRILRIFRQGQNDPFQALYSPTQDSYSF